ncbi:MAG: hypothetical protein M1820_009088 [Bogoriella megaspora]|nr:MAG: hypothetical protein M1820_009088 [Bogoriella megaspora]
MTCEQPKAVYWIGKEDWAYPLIFVISLDFVEFDSECEKWGESLGGDFDKKIGEVMGTVDTCVEQFEVCIKYAEKVIDNMEKANTIENNKSFLRLWKLLECTINQHIALLERFASWVDKRTEENQNTGRPLYRKGISERRSRIESELKSKLEGPVSDGFAQLKECKLPEQDLHVFDKGEDELICRVPQEIVLLLICVSIWISVPEEQAANVGQARDRMRRLLEELSTDKWKNEVQNPRPAPLVPETFCFDATKKRLGISRPFELGCSPLDQIFLQARDIRVSHPSAQADFKQAQDTLFKILGKENYKVKDDPDGSKWDTCIRSTFQREYNGPLQRYNKHVWQAIGRDFSAKEQCKCCRAYYNAILVKEEERSGKESIAMSRRRFGTCAESCLHAEECLSREPQTENNSADRSS